MIIWIAIIVVFIYFIKDLINSDYAGSNSLEPSKVNGSKSDDVETLLRRLDYGNNITTKMNHFKWLTLYSVILSFFISIFLLNKLPNSKVFLGTVFITFILLNAFRNFIDHHRLRFINYFMDRNIQLIKAKLNIKKTNKKLKPNVEKGLKSHYYIYKNLDW